MDEKAFDLLFSIRDILCDIREQNDKFTEKNNAVVDMNIDLKRSELSCLKRMKKEKFKE